MAARCGWEGRCDVGISRDEDGDGCGMGDKLTIYVHDIHICGGNGIF